MPDLTSKLEIERIENLISNFGWKVIKQEIKDDEIVLKVSKPISAPVVETDPGVG